MSFNTSFGSQPVQTSYTRLVQQLITLLSWRVMANLKSEQIPQQWALNFMSVYTKMSRIEIHKPSTPKFSSLCDQIVDFYSCSPPQASKTRINSAATQQIRRGIQQMRPAGILNTFKLPDPPRSRQNSSRPAVNPPKSKQRKYRFHYSQGQSEDQHTPIRGYRPFNPRRDPQPRNYYELVQNYNSLAHQVDRLKEAMYYIKD